MEVTVEKIIAVNIKLNKNESELLKLLVQNTAWTDDAEQFRHNLWVALSEAGVETI